MYRIRKRQGNNT